MDLYVTFSYSGNNEQKLKSHYADYDDNYITKIQFNNSTNSNSGTIYKVRKRNDINSITIELDDAYFDYLISNQYNKKLVDYDLRLIWYMNHNKTGEVFYFKRIRESKYAFSKYRICEHYTVDKPNRNITIACINEGNLLNKTNNKYYCIDHFAKNF